MKKVVYRFVFDVGTHLEDVEAAMVLALFATESLHGLARTQLEGAHHLDRDQRRLVLDASTPVGRDLCRLFTGFLVRELGPDGFKVEQVSRKSRTAE